MFKFSQSAIGKSLIGVGGGVSHKRVIVYWGMVLFTAIVIAAFFGKNVPEMIVGYVIGIIFGFAGYTTYETVNKRSQDVKMKQAENPAPIVNATINKNESADVTNVIVPDQETKTDIQ